MNKIKVTLFLSTLLLTSSCTYSVAFLPFTDYITPQEDEVFNNQTYQKGNSYLKDYYDVVQTNFNSDSRTDIMKATGEQKLLVLPVAFTDYMPDKLDNQNGSKALINIENVFFGAKKKTSWNSVTSFYNESSYGKLDLTGSVAPWFILPETYSVANLKTRVHNTNNKVNETRSILDLALKNYVNLGGDLSEFDKDENGVIDGVYLIYSAPYESNDQNNLFWAFVTTTNRRDSSFSAQPNMFAWSSYYFTEVNAFSRPNARTYIHETAHILGLSDYYNINPEDNFSPLGGFDMMDYTLGDHSGLSKMLLNWTYPYTMKQSGRITLRPFVESGDLLLLKNTWNGSATDEYILLEYYTPKSLNYADSVINNSFKLPSKSGVKVYHVDARTVVEDKTNVIANYTYSTSPFVSVDKVELLAHSNNTGRSNSAPKKDNFLYRLLEPSGRTVLADGTGLASAKSLFTVGDDFNKTFYSDFVFNDGTIPNFSFEIETINSKGVTVKIDML